MTAEHRPTAGTTVCPTVGRTDKTSSINGGQPTRRINTYIFSRG